MGLNWRNVFKSWAGVPVLILVVLAVIWVFTNGLPGYKIWQAKRAYDKLSEPYYKDTYGGKTPEETYDLFIDALKKGDVELASKYFVVEKQDSWLETLEEYKRKNLLTNFITELEETSKKWTKVDSGEDNFIQYESTPVVVKEKTKVDYNGDKLEVPVGSYSNFTQFQKYPSGVWKIATL